MIRRDRSRSQATPTARVRRRQEAALHEQRRAAADADALAAGGTVTQRRRRMPIKVVLLIGLMLILLVTIIGGILLWGRVSDFNARVSTVSATSSALWGPLGGDQRVNVALLGYGGEEHKSGNFLADSIQIMSIDPVAETTTVIPLPRDFWVEGLAAMPGNGKINEAFAVGYERGGIEDAGRLTTEVLSEVTGLRIDHWMAIDFSGFREMVDALGGIEVKNTRRFKYTWSEALYRNGRFPDGKFNRGVLQLNGDEALAYARVRYTNHRHESSDFARSIRQSKVLQGLRDKLGSGGLSSIGPGLSMMDALEGNLRTNLSALDLFLLSGHLNPDRRIELKEGRILEATTNTAGQYILVVVNRTDATDYEPLQRYLARQLAKPIRSRSAAPS